MFGKLKLAALAAVAAATVTLAQPQPASAHEVYPSESRHGTPYPIAQPQHRPHYYYHHGRRKVYRHYPRTYHQPRTYYQPRVYHRPRTHYPPHVYYPRRPNNNAAIAAGIAGVIVGTAIANSRSQYRGNWVGSQAWYNYCRSKYRSFDARSGTYMTYRGVRRACR